MTNRSNSYFMASLASLFIMLLVLFFAGAGNYVSLDYWIARRWRRHPGD